MFYVHDFDCKSNYSNEEEIFLKNQDEEEDIFKDTLFKKEENLNHSYSLDESFDDVYKAKTPDYTNTFNTFQNEEENEINIFIGKIQEMVFPLYTKGEFDKIMELLLQNFPKFFEGLNYNFLYIIQKLTFFKLLNTGQENEIKKFYFEELLRILKEVKPKNWKEKDSYFQRIIINPGIFLKENILEKYYEQFTFELDKAIRVCLADDTPRIYRKESEDIKFSFDFYGDPLYEEEEIIDTSSKNKKGSKKDKKDKKNTCEDISKHPSNVTQSTLENQHREENGEDQENENAGGKYELDMSDRSTKEEFSDFEDEFSAKFNNLNATLQKDLNGNYEVHYERKEENPKEDNEEEGTEEVQIYENNDKTNKLIQPFSDKNETIPLLDDVTALNKFIFSQKCIWKDIPFVVPFKPKFAKREVLNKKILRKFCCFVKQNKDLEIGKEFRDIPEYIEFYVIFREGIFLPPMKFYLSATEEEINFKTFNDSYLFFLFSAPFVVQYYQLFITQKFKDIFDDICNYYKVSEVEKVPLENYIRNLGFIFDVSRTNDQQIQKITFNGDNLKKENLFNRKNIEKTQRYMIKKERSRENDYETRGNKGRRRNNKRKESFSEDESED
ncbi:MAG: hypothetical protein MJ252_10160 [archaeon]|nr:hypothetical protein [archaeon]